MRSDLFYLCDPKSIKLSKSILKIVLLLITAMFMLTCASMYNLDNRPLEKMKGSYLYLREINLNQCKRNEDSESVSIEIKTAKCIELLDEIEFSNWDLTFLRKKSGEMKYGTPYFDSTS